MQWLEQVDDSPADGHHSSTLSRFRERALELLQGSEARRAFDIDREHPRVRDRYGRYPLGQNLLLSRRLIEGGVRLPNIRSAHNNEAGPWRPARLPGTGSFGSPENLLVTRP